MIRNLLFFATLICLALPCPAQVATNGSSNATASAAAMASASQIPEIVSVSPGDGEWVAPDLSEITVTLSFPCDLGSVVVYLTPEDEDEGETLFGSLYNGDVTIHFFLEHTLTPGKTYNCTTSIMVNPGDGYLIPLMEDWSFSVLDPAKEVFFEVAGCNIESQLNGEGGDVNVVVPYYSDVNYQDFEEVEAGIDFYGHTLNSFTLANDDFNTKYALCVDGKDYTLTMQRAYFRARDDIKLAGDDAYALYRMPTLPIEKGNEPAVITLVADVNDVDDLNTVPAFSGTLEYYDGTTPHEIAAENITFNAPEKDEGNGCQYAKGTFSFTYNDMTVKGEYILNYMPGTGRYRVWDVEEIAPGMYIPNEQNQVGDRNYIVYRGVTIHNAAGNPKNPVTVSQVNPDDPDTCLELDGFRFYHTLNMGGSTADSEAGIENPKHRYLSVNVEDGEVVTVLVSSTQRSMFRMFRMFGNCGSNSQARELERGASTWWSNHIVNEDIYVNMVGYPADDSNGGNVQYSFIEVAPGETYTATEGLSVEALMSTVEEDGATRVLASNADKITVSFTTPADNSIVSYRPSMLNLRYIGELQGGEDMANQDLSQAEGGDVVEENIIPVDLLSETRNHMDNRSSSATTTLVVAPQKPLQGNSRYELWMSDAALIFNRGGQPGPSCVSLAAPVYFIYTAGDAPLEYDFETLEGGGEITGDRTYPSNVYPYDYNTSLSAVTANAGEYGFMAEANGSRMLEVVGNTGTVASVQAGFDTPTDYPGTQTDKGDGYQYIMFDVYVPDGANRSAATPVISLSTNEGTPIQMVSTGINSANGWVWNSHQQEMTPGKDCVAESVGTPAGTWYTALAAGTVAGVWFDPLEATRRVYIEITGTDLAYIDNVKFIKDETIVPTSVEENINSGAAIYYNGHEIVNPTEERVYVYNIAGALVLSEDGNANVSNLPRGIYIARCGNQVLKIRR